MKTLINSLLAFTIVLGLNTLKAQEQIEIHPINHGSFVMTYQGNAFYTDPVGDAELYKDHPSPTVILITDIHGDHLSLDTLQSLNLDKAVIIAPQAVFDKLPLELQKKTQVLNNGDSNSYSMSGLNIEAVPMYNLREEALNFHPKGRGNGYVISLAGERIYISGDTEDITEMRELTNIDRAFICMNLPYTMTVESAASAVLDFKPKIVIPYHYRGKDGLSDIENFKRIILSKNSDIKVELLNWY
ncbi:MBL fold metallo-hydrolase [Paucihalobacter ruber]|uniref:MBL fold metallo-hydrolase n=1 Tax=Paucihalobacter ruber TaxID=2567861 RepID=A0A506PF00_9FLAO|nr:MBL fold metallo-hydrolase [Paucihalobacter ruber]TPV32406.1 MBL fold metallo-hydrolase [Paucihalobacter ruber]